MKTKKAKVNVSLSPFFLELSLISMSGETIVRAAAIG